MTELCCEYLPVRYIWLNVIIMSRRRFRGNLHSLVAWMSRNSLLGQNRRNIWSLSVSGGIRTHKYLVRKRILNHLAKLVKWLCCVVSTHLYGAFDCMLYDHVTYAFWSETTLSIYLMSNNSLLKTAGYLKFKLQQRDLNPQALSS